MTTAHRPEAPARPEGNTRPSSHSDEYEHTPVPASARRSLPSVAATWFGFPMNLGSAVFGGVIVYNLGLPQGLLAILVGNLVLFAHVGALSHHAGSTGKNFALLTADTFGSRAATCTPDCSRPSSSAGSPSRSGSRAPPSVEPSAGPPWRARPSAASCTRS